MGRTHAPYDPEGKTGGPPLSLMSMLRIHFMQQGFTWSDPAIEEAFLTPRCTGSLLNRNNLAACQMSPPFFGSDAGSCNLTHGTSPPQGFRLTFSKFNLGT